MSGKPGDPHDWFLNEWHGDSREPDKKEATGRRENIESALLHIPLKHRLKTYYTLSIFNPQQYLLGLEDPFDLKYIINNVVTIKSYILLSF